MGKLYMCILTKENSSHPIQVFLNETFPVKLPRNLAFFSPELLSHCSQIIYTRLGLVFFKIIFFFNSNKTIKRNKSKATNFTNHRRETSFLHTLRHKCLKSFDFITLLQSLPFYYTKLLDTLEEDSQVLEFVNPQPCPQYFETFRYFTKFFFHHK